MSTTEFYFSIPGEPKGKGRARSFAKLIKGGKIIQGNYTPDKTRNHEAFVKERFLAMNPNPVPLQGYVGITILAYFSIPKSASKKNRAAMKAGLLRPTRKPDIKNIQASVEDALNTIAYRDDSQIVHSQVDKYYEDIPTTLVRIREIGMF